MGPGGQKTQATAGGGEQAAASSMQHADSLERAAGEIFGRERLFFFFL